MQVERIRSEVPRLLRQTPFRPFAIKFMGGELALIEHPENVAFDPSPGSSSEFYVLSGNLRMFSTFEAISSMSIISGSGTVPGEPASA